jgi:hypothetical protein
VCPIDHTKARGCWRRVHAGRRALFAAAEALEPLSAPPHSGFRVGVGSMTGTIPKSPAKALETKAGYRRGWDSNPRSPFASVAITCFSNSGVTEILPVNGRL